MKSKWYIGIGIILSVWTLTTITGLINPLFLPSPLAVFLKFGSLVFSGEIFADIFATIWRTLLGYSLGVFFGVIFGLLMGRYRYIYSSFEFPVDFFRSIPATALFPLFIVIFGIGESVKVFIAGWAACMVVLINTIYGIRSSSKIRVQVAKLKRLPDYKVFIKVTIPDAMPFIIAGMRVALSFALIVEIVSEMFLGSHSGLGYRIFNATSIFEMEEAYSFIFVVGMLGYALNKLLMYLENCFVHWT